MSSLATAPNPKYCPLDAAARFAGLSVKTLERRIAAGSDDAEEYAVAGSIQLGSVDIEMVTDGTVQQLDGLRFTNLTIPRDATVTRAYLQFEAKEIHSEATTLTLQAQAAGPLPRVSAGS